jgi:hypothetical protein
MTDIDQILAEEHARLAAADWHQIPRGHYAIHVFDEDFERLLGYKLFERKTPRTFKNGRTVGRNAWKRSYALADCVTWEEFQRYADDDTDHGRSDVAWLLENPHRRVEDARHRPRVPEGNDRMTGIHKENPRILHWCGPEIVPLLEPRFEGSSSLSVAVTQYPNDEPAPFTGRVVVTLGEHDGDSDLPNLFWELTPDDAEELAHQLLHNAAVARDFQARAN